MTCRCRRWHPARHRAPEQRIKRTCHTARPRPMPRTRPSATSKTKNTKHTKFRQTLSSSATYTAFCRPPPALSKEPHSAKSAKPVYQTNPIPTPSDNAIAPATRRRPSPQKPNPAQIAQNRTTKQTQSRRTHGNQRRSQRPIFPWRTPVACRVAIPGDISYPRNRTMSHPPSAANRQTASPNQPHPPHPQQASHNNPLPPNQQHTPKTPQNP